MAVWMAAGQAGNGGQAMSMHILFSTECSQSLAVPPYLVASFAMVLIGVALFTAYSHYRKRMGVVLRFGDCEWHLVSTACIAWPLSSPILAIVLLCLLASYSAKQAIAFLSKGGEL